MKASWRSARRSAPARGAAPDAAGRKPAALRRRRGARRAERAADGGHPGPLRVALLGPRARSDGRLQHALGRGGLAVAAAVLLAFVPRLPSADASHGFGLSSGSVRITGSTSRRLRVFAVTQIAASFVLLAGAGMLLKTLLALQAAQTGFDTRHVLAMNVPVMSYGRTAIRLLVSTRTRCDASRRCRAWIASQSAPPFPGATRVPSVPGSSSRRTATSARPAKTIRARGSAPCRPGSSRRSACRSSPGAISTIADRRDGEPGRHREPEPGAAHVPESGRGQPPHHVDRSGDEVHRRQPRAAAHHRRRGRYRRRERGAGPGADRVSPLRAGADVGGRLFVHARADPYALVPPITRIIRDMSADQPVERAATLEDVRAEVLTPDRLNALVFGGFAAVALAIAVVGVAGVLAFSVSGRTREFGIRLAIGSQPRHVLTGVIAEGAVMAAPASSQARRAGSRWRSLAGSYFPDMRMPGAVPVAGSAAVLLAAAVVASVLPAARAARVDVMQALRSD